MFILTPGGAPIIKLGDKEVEYNFDFRFYITTKLSNPHYSPEIATKSTICNFAVKEQGLEAQLLGKMTVTSRRVKYGCVVKRCDVMF